MSEYDEAIAYWEEFKQEAIEMIANGQEVDGELTEQVPMCELALAALRDAAERAKGCDYCNPDNIDYYYAGNVPNYCKHCGRKLAKEARG